MINDLKFAPESRADGEGETRSATQQKSAVFTHFLTQKFAPLSIPHRDRRQDVAHEMEVY